jgi:hypothetical protein
MVQKDYTRRGTCKAYLLMDYTKFNCFVNTAMEFNNFSIVNVRSLYLQLQRGVNTPTQYRFPHILATTLQTGTGPTTAQQLLCVFLASQRKVLVWVFRQQNSHSPHHTTYVRA